MTLAPTGRRPKVMLVDVCAPYLEQSARGWNTSSRKSPPVSRFVGGGDSSDLLSCGPRSLADALHTGTLLLSDPACLL